MTHTISILVQNQPGVLAQLSELFRSHGYNIEKIKAGKSKKTSLTKIKIAATGSDESFESLAVQLGDISHVVDVDISRQRHYSFWLVAYCLCITLLGTNLPAPLYAVYRSEWQMSSGIITFLYALYALIVIPTIIIVAQFSKQWGRKNVLFAGVIFSILGSVGFALSSGVSGLLIARCFQGLSVGILNGIAVTYMTDFHPKHDKVKSAFVAAIAGTLGNAVGPLVSGFLGDYSPYPMQFSYAVHVLLAVAGLLGLNFMLDSKTATKHVTVLQIPVISKSLRKPFLLAASASFLSWGVMSLMLSVIPTYLNLFSNQPSLSFSGAMVALVLGLSTIHQVILRKQPVFRLIVIGYVLLILGLLCLFLTLWSKSLLLLVLTTIFIGLGNGPSYAGSLAYLNQISTDDNRANMTSSFFVVTYLGVSIPVITLGYVGQWLGLTHAIQGYSCIMIALIVISLFSWLRKNKSEN
ncbi:MFS transporter [Domibacillus sp. DTU_2020_1001157_1_SI_ALB_TIR_016]|uniref:MFS transporter n=1 Tax=Domibacillus sp. DTU_2020_1001157_1_SI_ALB_TIR_016 TaxID=3077789 RepID=UPI0028EC83A4|nr:MFS transporter [Domibacillus sp. DTU_2020_1001157_1_SI_ALB_TIR_016]WNS78050.1 MFS transporter [Domibacillus sp. DTU_2020_1001157_1_SI_ALB_TIR_016]